MFCLVRCFFFMVLAVVVPCRYACVVLVVGVGLLGFRDPHGIRPLVYGAKLPKASGAAADAKTTHVLSSESVRCPRGVSGLGFVVGNLDSSRCTWV
jgi:glutamine phosphoribosylpyrophosphate amidotransferase